MPRPDSTYWLTRWLTGALFALSAALVAGAPARSAAPSPVPPVTTPAFAQGNDQSDDIAATERSVVRVVTVAIVNGNVVGFGHGSGVAIAPDRIVTNAHVVADAADYPDNVVIGIVPSEGSRSYPGRLIHIDRRRDLAIVQIVQGRIPAASIFTGPVGQRQLVYALGYPGNVDVATAQSMADYIRPRTPVASDGIVSNIDQINGVNALVHDADIARGNSGGPLVDKCGRVVGINTFISRADDGDSPFSFAISVQEIAAFLQDADQRFTGVATPCLTAAEAAARDAALTAEQQRARDEALARDAAKQAQQDAETLAKLRGAAESRVVTFLALALLLFGLAIVASGAAMMFNVQNKPREMRYALIAAGAGLLGAVIFFLARPDPDAVTLPARAAPASDARAAAANPPETYGSLICQVDRSRGRINVSTGEDAVLSITPDGCVNGRTQYVRTPDGKWSRTLVPNEDATITRLTYDPRTATAETQRYLMSLDAIEAIRRQRQISPPPSTCTSDPAVLDQLQRRENGVGGLLPPQPSEHIYSHCAAATPAVSPTAPAAAPSPRKP